MCKYFGFLIYKTSFPFPHFQCYQNKKFICSIIKLREMGDLTPSLPTVCHHSADLYTIFQQNKAMFPMLGQYLLRSVKAPIKAKTQLSEPGYTCALCFLSLQSLLSSSLCWNTGLHYRSETYKVETLVGSVVM